MHERSLRPIGRMKTCFSEKFGTPRQPGLIPAAAGVIQLDPNPDYALALQQLETFSHIWVLFLFDRHEAEGWRPLIRPPRVGAPNKVGVFASRAPHRPNAIGLSAVKLDRIDYEAPGGVQIHVSGVDILNDSPVVDIKPYLPYADSIPEASAGWAAPTLDKYSVTFAEDVLEMLRGREPREKDLIEQMAGIDPRPTSQRRTMPIRDPANEGRMFRFRIGDFDVEWRIQNSAIHVVALYPLAAEA